jgi:HAE1 family hydrophobic/amphiphilic exporter-1
MFPQDVGRRLYMPYHVEGQHSLERVEQTVDEIEDYLYSNQEKFNIRSVYSYFDQERAESTLLLTSRGDATLSTEEIIALIEEDLPQIAIGRPSFSFDDEGGGGGFTVQISGDSTEVLNDLSLEIARSLESVEGLKDVLSDGESGTKEVRVIIDRTRAANVGLTAVGIAQSISVAMRGQNMREFRDKTGEIAVRMAFRENDKQSIEQLASLPLYTPDGRRITLGTVASLRIGRSPDRIRRTDRQTAVILSANLEEDVSAEDVRPRVKSLMDQIELPPGYSWKEGRGFRRQDETADMMATNILLGIACIFLVMAALFESIFPVSVFFCFSRQPVQRSHSWQ